jgi:hypothetical protein
MVTEKCNICGATWDNRVASHKKGLDCAEKIAADAHRLAELLDQLKKKVETLDKQRNEQDLAMGLLNTQAQAVLQKLREIEKRMSSLKN